MQIRPRTVARTVEVVDNVDAFSLLCSLQKIASIAHWQIQTSRFLAKAVPEPKLLIEDHKKKKANGLHPTRLVVLAKNFRSLCSEAGAEGMQKNIRQK